MKKLYTIVLTVLTIFHSIAARTEEPQLWNILNVENYRKDALTISSMIHTRWHKEEDFLRFFQFAERFSWKISENLSLGANYSFLGTHGKYIKSNEEGGYYRQHRLEAEVNPRFKITNSIKYLSRNRFEYLTKEDFDYLSTRVRHRSTIEVPLTYKQLSSLFISSEIFYNLTASQFDQVRTIPLGLRLKSGSIVYTIAPMIQSNKRENSWSETGILLTELSF
jgi:hypothetical protein